MYLLIIVKQNFFSTEFVSQVQVGASTKIVVTENVWLFWAIAIPFTLGTVVVWWLWVRLQAGRIVLPRPTSMINIAEKSIRRTRRYFKGESEA